jgi:hypothetical protein
MALPNISNSLPDSADAGKPVKVKDLTVNEDSVTFVFEDTAGKALNDFVVNAKSCNGLLVQIPRRQGLERMEQQLL